MRERTHAPLLRALDAGERRGQGHSLKLCSVIPGKYRFWMAFFRGKCHAKVAAWGGADPRWRRYNCDVRGGLVGW